MFATDSWGVESFFFMQLPSHLFTLKSDFHCFYVIGNTFQVPVWTYVWVDPLATRLDHIFVGFYTKLFLHVENLVVYFREKYVPNKK